MANEIGQTREHVLELHPGGEGEIEFAFAMEELETFTVGLAAVDPVIGTAELVLDDMWGGYEMNQFVKDENRWRSIWPGEDGEVRAVVRFGPGKHVSISSDLARRHSLSLTDVAWQSGSLRLTFQESA